MKLLVDGVFFQIAQTGIARVWSTILRRLAGYPDLEIVMLDRGGCPLIDGVQRVEFPSYTWTQTAADSLLLNQICQSLKVDVFTSTYYTTPTTIPSVLLVYDMIPEVLGFDLNQRGWQEKQIAISFASYYACISETTRSDLGRFYPATKNRSIVAYCGVDRDVFRPLDKSRTEEFRKKLNISKPYYLLVGAREQLSGYKNGSLVFKAAREIRDLEIEILCAGGEPEIPPALLAVLPANVTARRVDFTDDELACAYSGAEALIVPSRYEGFGMPVIEAMACGCPVICTNRGSLKEVAADAAISISGDDEDELRSAMRSVRDPATRRRLIESGLQRVSPYDWNVMTRLVHGLLEKARQDCGSPEMADFTKEWSRLRTIQAEVDI
jgi:glycosyltransferase involved in cell wall biosynthesis